MLGLKLIHVGKRGPCRPRLYLFGFQSDNSLYISKARHISGPWYFIVATTMVYNSRGRYVVVSWNVMYYVTRCEIQISHIDKLPWGMKTYKMQMKYGYWWY